MWKPVAGARYAFKDWVEAQTSSGRYDNANEYVRDLIRYNEDRTSKISAMQKLVDEAFEGGVSGESAATRGKALGKIRADKLQRWSEQQRENRQSAPGKPVERGKDERGPQT